MAGQWVKLQSGDYVPQSHALASQPGASAPGYHPNDIATGEAPSGSQPAGAGQSASPAPAPTPPGTPGGQPTQQPAPAPSATPAPLATNPAAIQQPFYTALHGLLSQTGHVTTQTPQVAEQIAAARVENQRAHERDRMMLAERAAAQGLSGSGAFESDLLGLAQARGERDKAATASALRWGQDAQDARLMASLGIGQGIMQQGDAAQLQRELAALDADLRRQGLSIQSGDLDLRRALGTGQLDLQRQLGHGDLDFRYRQLGQQGDQFGQSLSLQALIEQERIKQAYLLALLNAGR